MLQSHDLRVHIPCRFFQICVAPVQKKIQQTLLSTLFFDTEETWFFHHRWLACGGRPSNYHIIRWPLEVNAKHVLICHVCLFCLAFVWNVHCAHEKQSWAARGPQMSWSNRECRWQVVLGHQIPRASRGSSGRRRYQWSRWMRLGHGETSWENPILIILIQSERMLINAN